MKTITRPSGEVFGSGNFPARDARVLDEELAVTSDTDLEAAIVSLKRHMDALHAEWLTRIAEYDRRQVAEVRHGLSTTGWLKATLRLTGRVAARFVRLGRGLRAMPAVADAAADGAVPPDALTLLDRARRRHPEAFAGHEGVFADIATYLDLAELRQAIGHWEQQIDFPSAVARTRSQRRRRRLSINQTFDGMWAVAGELDPESGAIVHEALEAVGSRAYLDESDPRAPWHVRADALVDICEQAMRHNTTHTSKGTKPHLTVSIDGDVLLGLRNGFAETYDAPIPPETLARISCDTTIVRILTDAAGNPINVGRATRVIPPALRRALDRRDRHCQWGGCSAPADWCDAHHMTPWSDGGRTDLDNLTLLCRVHHTATHEAMTRARGP
ncbi:MAG: DUF222 domain-containing protein [Acidimicrobiia bacterium]|nr:DUF222 domain-containing protein [Acidimicrobiia bacterium]